MLYAILAVLSFALQNVCCKEFGGRFPRTLYAQTVMIAVSMTLVALIMAITGGIQLLSGAAWLTAIAFGAAFVLTLASMTIAMNIGHMGLTLLIQNTSLLIPTLCGVFLWKEALTPVMGVGIALILALLVMSAGEEGGTAGDGGKAHGRRRWLAFTAAAFLGDGALSILQKLMSDADASISSVTFTFWTSVFSTALAGVIALTLLLTKRAPRMLRSSQSKRQFAACSAGIGVGTAGGNCFTILALTRLDGIVLFPLRQGALVLLMWMAGVLLYREKCTRRGMLMLLVGLAGLVLLNL